MDSKHQHNQEGFTLIELLLYVAVASLMIGAISTLLFLFVGSRIKNESIAQVEQQAAAALHTLTWVAQEATSITVTAPDTITIATSNPATNPTFLTLSSGILRFSAGGQPSVPLNSSDTTATSLVFVDRSVGDDHDSVEIEVSLEKNNPSGRNEYEASATAHTTITTR